MRFIIRPSNALKVGYCYCNQCDNCDKCDSKCGRYVPCSDKIYYA
ncbi:MAG: Clo7bot family Cys-rich peptide [Thermoanaerobacteraceae bacterium]